MAVFEQIKTHKVRFIQTLALYLAFLSNGLVSGIIGPTLLDLQISANATFNDITFVIPARSGGYAAGAILGKLLIHLISEYKINLILCELVGFLYTYINARLLASLALGATAALVAVTPWLRSATYVIVATGGDGIARGMIDAICNMSILHLWGKENPPFMQGKY